MNRRKAVLRAGRTGKPRPKFTYGDFVKHKDVPTMRGTVSFIGEYDEFLGGYRYKVEEPSGRRVTWNESSMVKVRKV